MGAGTAGAVIGVMLVSVGSVAILADHFVGMAQKRRDRRRDPDGGDAT